MVRQQQHTVRRGPRADEYNRFHCPVIGLEKLIELKRAAGRPKDFEILAELETILDSYLVTAVFLYGSAAMLIVSLTVVTWLGRSTESAMVLRTRIAS